MGHVWAVEGNEAMKIIYSFLIVFFVWSTASLASDGFKFYGDFFIHETIPETAFKLTGIAYNDNLDFKELLVNEKIKVLVLVSLGGNVRAGLNIADRVHSDDITTYVPGKISGNDIECSSACTFIFFAGTNRYSKGRIGVHRFRQKESFLKYVVNERNAEDIVNFLIENQGSVQELTTEITLALKYYGVPDLVIKNTFFTDALDIHYFEGADLAEFNRLGLVSKTRFSKIDEFLRKFICFENGYPLGYRHPISSTCKRFPGLDEDKDRTGSQSNFEAVHLSFINCLESRDEPFVKKHFEKIDLGVDENERAQLKLSEAIVLMGPKPASLIGTKVINIKGRTQKMTFELFSENSKFWLRFSTKERTRMCMYDRM